MSTVHADSPRHLDTCLCVVPQARALVETGPYGGIVTPTGFAVRAGHWSLAALTSTDALTTALPTVPRRSADDRGRPTSLPHRYWEPAARPSMRSAPGATST